MSAGTTNETIVSITDDDLPSVAVSFAQGSYTVAEGSSVTVKVQLDADPERTVTIPAHQGRPGRGERIRLLRRAGQRRLQRQ